jgi:mono/diheme cytochrome c family protein
MKKLFWIIPLIMLTLILIFVLYLKLALPNVGKAPEITIEMTPDRLARGEYLANSVMGCVDCHSQRDFTKFSGPLTGVPYAGGGEEFTVKQGAPGNFYAPNLTPFHLSDWTDGEIYRAITSGVSKDGRALFPSMPAHLYGKASLEDIYSVIAYLRTLKPFENSVPEADPNFPFSLIMNLIPKKADHRNMPDRGNLAEYGEYVITLAACIDCHTNMVKGQYVMEEAYAGNREFILPTGIVRTANITPHPVSGIGAWTEEMFIQRFKMYNDSAFTLPSINDGYNTIMPWTMYAGMDEIDLKAIYAYLKTIKPINKEVVKFTPK